jgi:uncharacterized membrane protein SirB2
MTLLFFYFEEGISFWSNNLNIIHLHFLFALLFLVSYTIKSVLFLAGKQESFLTFKKKTILIETIFAVGFLVFGFWMFIFHIKSGNYKHMHWLDPKITLALLAIPLGIVGFKKGNKTMVALSLLSFFISLIIGLLHYQ